MRREIMSRRRNRKRELPSFRLPKSLIVIFTIIFSFIIFSTFFSIININNTNIIYGIFINGIKIGGLSRDDARVRLEEKLEKKLIKEITIKKEDLEIKIKPKQFLAEYDYDKILSDVYSLGRNKNIFLNNFEILRYLIIHGKYSVELKYDEALLNEWIDNLSLNIPNPLKEYSYYIDGEKLIIVSGKEGNVVEKDLLKKEILNCIENNDENFIEIPTRIQQPSKIDIDNIYKEIHKEAKDAYIDKASNKVYPEVTGIDFNEDIEKIRLVFEIPQDEYSIDLKFTPANKTVNDLGEDIFVEELSKAMTKYDASYKERSTNLEIATKKINNKILMPNEEFSFNKIVGNRTANGGYKEAAIYANGKVEQGIGGGICQISSTLYNAVLFANLEIKSRSNHYFLPSYAKAGLDATVSWGSIDFVFKNTRSYPIKISAETRNGVVTIKIFGVKEENEYEVLIKPETVRTIPFETIYEEDKSIKDQVGIIKQEGKNGIEVQTYRILKSGNIERSKELISSDIYNAIPQIISVPAKK